MIIRIPYGYKPGEKIVGEGLFICPLCHCKRPYARIKLTKNYFFGIFSIPVQNMAEFIQCGGCLKSLTLDFLDAQKQLGIEVSDELTPKEMFDIWERVYKNVQAEAILANDKTVVEGVTPVLFTTAKCMQEAGVAIKLGKINDARQNLYNILLLTNEWLTACNMDNFTWARKVPKLHSKQMEFNEVSHLLLSKLPLENK
ncbi:MAG: hypothetical protein AB1531_07085 [Chloroflexota bacterium]